MMERKNQLINEYEINNETMMILPILYGSKIFSKIIEINDECISPFKPFDIVKESCYIFGSSYDGRKEATRRLIGCIHKAPIALSSEIFLFPTLSPENPKCFWFSVNHILSFYDGEKKGTTLIKFRNQRSILLPVSRRTLENQYLRTIMLQKKLREKDEKKNMRFLIQKSAEDVGEYFW